ncbi:MAG: hypothetical protein R3C03_01850 [Pirellulaceae bacterium]
MGSRRDPRFAEQSEFIQISGALQGFAEKYGVVPEVSNTVAFRDYVASVFGDEITANVDFGDIENNELLPFLLAPDTWQSEQFDESPNVFYAFPEERLEDNDNDGWKEFRSTLSRVYCLRRGEVVLWDETTCSYVIYGD